MNTTLTDNKIIFYKNEDAGKDSVSIITEHYENSSDVYYELNKNNDIQKLIKIGLNSNPSGTYSGSIDCMEINTTVIKTNNDFISLESDMRTEIDPVDDKSIVNRLYVNNAISNIPPTDLSSLNEKTQKLDTDGNINSSIIASSNLTVNGNIFMSEARGDALKYRGGIDQSGICLYPNAMTVPSGRAYQGGIALATRFNGNNEVPIISWDNSSGGNFGYGTNIKFYESGVERLRIGETAITTPIDFGTTTSKVPNIHCENIFYTQTNPVLRATENQNVNVSDTFLLLNNKIETKTAGYTNENNIIQLTSNGDIQLTSAMRIFYQASMGHFFQGAVSGVSLKFEPKGTDDIDFDEENDDENEIAVYLNTDGKLHIKKRSDGSDNPLIDLSTSRTPTTYDINLGEDSATLFSATTTTAGIMSKDDKIKLDTTYDYVNGINEFVYSYNPYANPDYHKIWEDDYIELFFYYTGSSSSYFRQPVYRIKQMPTNYSKWCHNFTYRKGGGVKTGGGTGIYTNTYLPFYASSFSWILNTSYNFEDTAVMECEIFPEQESGSNFYEFKFMYGSRNSLITKIRKIGNDQSSFGLVDELIRTDTVSVSDQDRITQLEDRLNSLVS